MHSRSSPRQVSQQVYVSIEALTGEGLMRYYENQEQELAEAAKAAKTTPADLKAKIESMLEEIKALHAENDKLKSKLANECSGRCYEPGTVT